MNIAQSYVLVTGGGRGIGRYLADQIGMEAAQVVIIEKDAAFCAELNNSGEGQVRAWQCDVSDPVAVDATLQAIFDSGFEPNVLINNAGIIHNEPLVNMLARGDRVHSRESWRHVLATNLDSVFFVTSRVVDRMLSKRTKGVVISISSISANGNPGQSAYSAAKAAVNALTCTWAKELGGFGLRFASIAPGFIDTLSTREALSETSLAKLQQQIPLRKLGDLRSIYLAARHIIENDYLTGTVLQVDGGLVI